MRKYALIAAHVFYVMNTHSIQASLISALRNMTGCRTMATQALVSSGMYRTEDTKTNIGVLRFHLNRKEKARYTDDQITKMLDTDVDAALRAHAQKYHPDLKDFNWTVGDEWFATTNNLISVPYSHIIALILKRKSNEWHSFSHEIGHLLEGHVEEAAIAQQLPRHQFEETRPKQELAADSYVPRKMAPSAYRYFNNLAYLEREAQFAELLQNSHPSTDETRTRFRTKVRESNLSKEKQDRILSMCNIPLQTHPEHWQRARNCKQQVDGIQGDTLRALFAPPAARNFFGLPPCQA